VCWLFTFSPLKDTGCERVGFLTLSPDWTHQRQALDLCCFADQICEIRAFAYAPAWHYKLGGKNLHGLTIMI
jgi:hypothetical protein